MKLHNICSDILRHFIVFFVAEILKSWEVFIFIWRDRRGSQSREILSPAGNITGMQESNVAPGLLVLKY
jgi:hypothetical protein